MAGFIEEFYYGNIDPQTRSVKPNTAVQKEMQKLTDYEKKLTNRLTGEDKKVFSLTQTLGAWSTAKDRLTALSLDFCSGQLLLLSGTTPYTDYLKEE